MVRRLVTLLYSEVRGLHEAAYLLGLFALGSQLLAIIRSRVLADLFGAGPMLDVYNAAFRIPDFLFAAIASMVSVYVLIPILSERLKEHEDSARAFLAGALTFFTSALALAGAVAWYYAPDIISLLYPGFSGDAHELTVAVTRVMLVQPILLGASNLFASVTQLRQRFVVYAVSPLVYNIGIIIGAVVLYPRMGLVGLGWGVVLGAFLHLAIQVPGLWNDSMAPRWFGRVSLRDIRSIVSLSLPRTIALSVHQVSLMVLIGTASLFAAGSISVFTFGHELSAVPLSIIGVSYSIAAFPTLARLFSTGERDAFFAQITTAARHIIFWSLPVIALFVVLRAQIVRVLFGSGSFDWTDTRLTAAVLAVFVVSLAAHGLVLLLVRGYYAAGDTLKPLLINVFSSVLGVSTALLCVELFQAFPEIRLFVERLLRIEAMPGTEVVMLAFGYSVGIVVNATLLLGAFERDFSRFGSAVWGGIWKSLLGAVMGGVASYVSLQVLDDAVDINTFIGITTQGVLAGVAGVAAFVGTLWLLKSTELSEAMGAINQRIFRTHPVVPDEQGNAL
jgi:putative peptidoglycan lipid II flippase